MQRISVHEYRKRFDADLANDLLRICVSKKIAVMMTHQDKVYYSRVLRFELEDRSPYVVFDAFMPEEGNRLAQEKKEVSLKFDFLHKGSLFHVRSRTILCGLGEIKGIKAVVSTPPLDIKMASESFTGKPTPNTPLWVKIPLFKEELRLEVKHISINGFIFEDRLIADTLPAVQKLDRVHLDFGNDEEIVVPGSFRGAGGHKVEFRFDKVPEQELRTIEFYLEKLYIQHDRVKPNQKKEAFSKKAKKSKAESFHLLILTDDEAYVSELRNVLEGKEINLGVEKDIDTFYEKVLHHSWNLALIDGSFKDLDLWGMTRKLQELFKKGEQKPTPMAILSDDLSEDYVVYAQYCGMQHVLGRANIVKTLFKEIAALTGHRQWLSTDDQEKGKIVLIIDDDQNVTFPLEHALRQKGYTPIVVQKGNEGVRRAKMIRPGCILLEIAIRSRDGMDALRVLKKMPFTSKIPLIVLTASKDNTEKQSALQHGADEYLYKPVETKDLVNRIQALL